MKFPYRQYQVDPSPTIPDGILYRPMVRVRVVGLTRDASFWALLDTGADETILPMPIGLAIGAMMYPSSTWTMGGLAGQTVEATLGDVQFEVGQRRTIYQWKARVGFVSFPTPEDEVAILGHAGFLNFFTASFDSVKRELKMKPNANFPRAHEQR